MIHWPLMRMASMAIAAAAAAPVAAVPITVSNVGYWLDNVGSNTIGHGTGGSPTGVPRTLFAANTTPEQSAGTNAAAFFGTVPAGSPIVYQGQWVYAIENPTAAQRAPLTVVFSNGTDRASFTGRDLNGLVPMPLVQNLVIDGSGSPFSPLITWTLPSAAATGDLDRIQLVFYDNITDFEVGSRVTLATTATSYRIGATLPGNYDLTVRFRLIDLYDDGGAFAADNLLRESRTFANYLAPVPEPGTWALMGLGLAAIGARMRRRGAPRSQS